MRNNWARPKKGSPAIVKRPTTRAITHTIIGAIHSSSVVHIEMKKPPPRKEKKSASKKRKVKNGAKKRETEVDEEDQMIINQQKGTTTAHFVKFMNALLDIMDLDKNLKGNYIVMDNASIHKSQPIIRKIERRGYKVVYLPPYSPELNAIKQFWGVVKGKMKRDRLLAEKKLFARIAMMCSSATSIVSVITQSVRLLNVIKKHHSKTFTYLQ